MPKSLNDRTNVEMQLATYREIAQISVDEETIRYANQQIAKLEKKLRETDEQGRPRP